MLRLFDLLRDRSPFVCLLELPLDDNFDGEKDTTAVLELDCLDEMLLSLLELLSSFLVRLPLLIESLSPVSVSNVFTNEFTREFTLSEIDFSAFALSFFEGIWPCLDDDLDLFFCFCINRN